MCQYPRNPNPNPRKVEEQERERLRDREKQALVQELSLKLSNGDLSARIEAARDIRKLARASVKSRSAFAVSSVLNPLVSMLSSPDREPKESALLALLNLAVRNERNKEVIVKSGATPHLIELLKSESTTLRELAAAAVLTLSASISNRPTIAASGAVPLLVQILVSGSIQGRVDAVTALYNLSNCTSTSLTLSIEATRPLLSLLRDCKKHSKFAEKATALLEILAQSREGMHSILETQSGILTLVETVEEGSLLSTEHAVGVLLALHSCCSRNEYREMILKEGPIPGLLLLTVDGSQNAQLRAQNLLQLLRDDDNDYCGKKKRVMKSEEELETIVYDIATRVDGPKRAEKTAKRLLQDMVQRNMELNMTRIQRRAAAASSGTHLTRR